MSDLEKHIKHYHSLTHEKDYDSACAYFIEHLDKPTLHGIYDDCYVRAPLLEMLFPDGVEKPSALKTLSNNIFVYMALPITYGICGGYPGKAVHLYRRHMAICEAANDYESMAEGMGNHSKALRQTGRFREAETIALKGLDVQRRTGKRAKEAINLYWVGMGLAHRGIKNNTPFIAMDRSIRIFTTLLADQSTAVTNAFKGQSSIWYGDWETAERCIMQAWDASKKRENTDFSDQQTVYKVLAASSRQMGEVELNRGNEASAINWLNICEPYTEGLDFCEEILPHLRVWADLELRRGNYDAARDYVKRSLVRAETGPYLLYNVDSYQILAMIEQACGNASAAIDAATQAYNLAWCDGPPYAYQRGLDDAAKLLTDLGAAAPEMPAFDKSRFEPIPDIEINTKDEYLA
jgi:tetratricopeptide (TPR) repeat protein